MDRRRLVYYLLLNVFVSACVTSTILFWYDRNYRATLAPAAPAVQSGGAAPAETLNPQTDIPIQIESVVGAGTPNVETAVIHYSGDEQLNLSGWQLKDEDGGTFTFPQLTLHKDGSVQVHSSSGTDTVIDLYWGINEAVWSSGENARLYDSQGNLRAVYRVP
jgi:hypothetical protein